MTSPYILELTFITYFMQTISQSTFNAHLMIWMLIADLMSAAADVLDKWAVNNSLQLNISRTKAMVLDQCSTSASSQVFLGLMLRLVR